MCPWAFFVWYFCSVTTDEQMLLLHPEIAIEHDGAPEDLVKGMAIYSAARLQSKGLDPSEVVGNGHDNQPKLDARW